MCTIDRFLQSLTVRNWVIMTLGALLFTERAGPSAAKLWPTRLAFSMFSWLELDNKHAATGIFVTKSGSWKNLLWTTIYYPKSCDSVVIGVFTCTMG